MNRQDSGELRRCIFHIDVNSAFLSWSSVKRLEEDPEAVDLREIPSAVGGDVKTRHGVITAKSIPAKAYGIQTGEPVVKALQKCPELVLVPSDFQTYRRYSRAFIQILHSYSEVVEQVSIDEAFVDMTGREEAMRRRLFEKIVAGELPPEASGWKFPLSAAEMIRREIRETLKFTVNVGISVNRLLAKMASDLEKPDRIHTLYPEEIREKLWPLPVGELHGCGGKTREKLRRLGIHTIGEAAAMEEEMLKSLLGEKAGEYIYRSANGQGSDVICPDEEELQSCSNEITLAEDVGRDNLESTGMQVVRRLSEKVSGRLRKDGLYARTVTLQVKTEEFTRRSRQKSFQDSFQDADRICAAASELLREMVYGRDGLFEQGHTLRLIGVGTSALDHGEYRQITLEEFLKNQQDPAVQQEKQKSRVRSEKQKKLEKMTEQLRKSFGEGAIQKGKDYRREFRSSGKQEELP